MKFSFKAIVQKLLSLETSPQRMARSLTLGTALAFSPFVGLQTPLIFPIAFLLNANSAVVFFTLYLISNPFTFAPIVLMCYLASLRITVFLFGSDLSAYDPVFLQKFSQYIASFLPASAGVTHFSFSAFMIGGNLLVLAIALLSYPIFSFLCAQLFKKSTKKYKTGEAQRGSLPRNKVV